LQDLESIVSRALADFSAAGDPASLENAKARFVGKAGELTALQSTLKSAPPEQRRELGAQFNAAKQKIEAALEARRGGVGEAQRAPDG
jgi:phenylalanyl-tRNA synthetase alpha chain